MLGPTSGFVWSARAAGLIAGTDRYLDGAGASAWKLAGLVTVAAASGPDVARGAAGRVGSLVFDRWGDPGGGGRFGWHRFGGEGTGYATLGGLTVPAAGRLGWHWGGDGWERGEFFRYRITALEPSGEPPARSR